MNETEKKTKQQILYGFLPGRVIDFSTAFAKIRSVVGDPFDEINKQVLLNKIKQQARAWAESNRPGLEDKVFEDSKIFAIVNPKGVRADLYPLVFWCENNSCNHLIDYSRQGPPNTNICPSCKQKTLVQFRFIKAHQCGYIDEIRPPKCSNCHSDKNITLRGLLDFERFRDFQWFCKKCKIDVDFYSGYCPNCEWPITNGKEKGQDSSTKEKDPRRLEVLLFRTNRQYYTHTATLINIPKKAFDSLLSLEEHWHIVTGAKYLNIPSIKESTLKEISAGLDSSGSQKGKIGMEDSLDYLKQIKEGKMTFEEVEKEMKRKGENQEPAIEEYRAELIKMSGLEESYWKGSKFSILDSVIPGELGNLNSLRKNSTRVSEHRTIDLLGINDIQLIDDFPIITSSFGYTRLSYNPEESWLRTFDGEGEQKGKIPIFVDSVSADALFFQLDYDRVRRWLIVNGMNPDIPSGTSEEASLKSYFVKLFTRLDTHKTLSNDNREAKFVLSLLHTLSHLSIRRAEVLCGLERTSISEYLIPSTLSFAMYCNHRFGGTIGALTSLFDQALLEWLEQIFGKRTCVYDPVCQDKMGNCHACTHLPETSCRHFNLNLGRVYLFGGTDIESSETIRGYFQSDY
jgi:hypothetical protein